MSVRSLSKAKAMAVQSAGAVEQRDKFRDQFAELLEKSLDEQVEFFMKSFIFALGDDWKQVSIIGTNFKKYLNEQNEAKDLDPVQASDFLQKNGKVRTAVQRKEELEDIDLNFDGRIGLSEYFLLHYKIMILQEYFKRHEIAPTVSLEDDGVGLKGVGDMLLEELFTMPMGINPEIEEAIAAFMAEKRAKENKMAELESKAATGGVKGLAAKNELAQMNAADSTEENKTELTLKAAQRRASKYSAADQLDKQKKQEEALVQQKRRASRANLAQRAAMFAGSAAESDVSPIVSSGKTPAGTKGSGPCGSFTVDTLAAEFGTCTCGHKKREHAM